MKSMPGHQVNRLPAVLVRLRFCTTFGSPGLLNPLNAPPQLAVFSSQPGVFILRCTILKCHVI